MTLNENSETHKTAPTNTAAAARIIAGFPLFFRFRLFGQRMPFTPLSFHNIPQNIFCYSLCCKIYPLYPLFKKLFIFLEI